MAYRATKTLVIENAKIIWRNFSGKEQKYNAEGERNFCVIIDDQSQAKKLSEDGWNIKKLAKRDEDEEDRYYIQVKVSFDYMPPKIYLITNKTKVALDEESIATLDYAEIAYADISIRPYNWEINGKSGIKGYLRTLYVTLEEDEFEQKYAEEENPVEEDSEYLPF